MKKRILSGLLAMLLTFPSAFAAKGESMTLSFTAKPPSNSGADSIDENAAQKLKDVLNKRLEAIGCKNAETAAEAGSNKVTVMIPDGTDKEDISDYLSAPGVLVFADSGGSEYLVNADVESAGASPAEDGTTYSILVTLTEGGKEKLGEALNDVSERPDGENVLIAFLDKKEIARITENENLEETSIRLEVPDLESAVEQAGIINSGVLPVELAKDTAGTVTSPEPADNPGTGTVTEPAPAGNPDPVVAAEPEPVVSPSPYPDIENHWAKLDLTKAIELGLLKGTDGLIRPDTTITLAEAVTILNRTLGAAKEDMVTLPNVKADAWYFSEIGKALHIGLIANGDKRVFNKGATRAEAFEFIARAFSYDGVSKSGVLDPYPDTGSMSKTQKNAAAALISAGIVNGMSNGKLEPSSPLSRAQFVTMILRAAPEFISDEANMDKAANGALIKIPAVTLENKKLTRNQVFGCDTSLVSVLGATGSSRIVLKGADAAKLSVEKSSLGVVTLDPAGSLEADFDSTSTASTVVIPGKGGEVIFNGSTNDLQITSSGRAINLSGMNAKQLTVTGSSNTITLDGNVTNIEISSGAENNTLIVNGNAQTISLDGKGSKVSGSGKAGTIDKKALDCTVSLTADSVIDNVDTGLEGVKIIAGVPDRVTPGGTLLTQFKFEGVKGVKICSAQWLQDGKPIPGFYNPNFELKEGGYTRHLSTFNFTKDMQKSVTMGFLIVYENKTTGKTETLKAEKTVPIENYSDEWYYERDKTRILNLVSSVYRGNYTTSYAENHDYTNVEKEVWINAKGYSSSTEYLCWINRAYQRVNVFKGSKGNWKIIKKFIVGTGASSTPTPVGQTYVTYKSKAGWTTGNYTVRPVIGFYPDSGYAFHSRLCYPGTENEYDYSSGYPVSHGCVRMKRPDINWMYSNIPIGTRVVIY